MVLFPWVFHFGNPPPTRLGKEETSVRSDAPQAGAWKQRATESATELGDTRERLSTSAPRGAASFEQSQKFGLAQL